MNDVGSQQFDPLETSPLIDQGTSIPSPLLPAHQLNYQYLKHTNYSIRNSSGALDIGAFEYQNVACADTTTFMANAWTNGMPDPTKLAVIQSNFNTSVNGTFTACSCIVSENATLGIAPDDVLSILNELQVLGVLEVLPGGVIDVQN